MPVLANIIWGAFSWLFYNLPWLIIALMAALAWSRQRKSFPLILQVVAAAGLFLLAIVEPIILWLVWKTSPAEIHGAAIAIFNFMRVVAMLLFAGGFAWEKYLQWSRTPASATAVAVPGTP